MADGRLSLDAPVGEHPFTLRQLLQHTAGVPDYGGVPAYQEAIARKTAPWGEAELLRRVGADKSLFRPGYGWTYSNVGYLFVRRLIEDVTGEEVGEALHRLVFVPLGVPGVRLAREPWDLVDTAWSNAAGYHPGWYFHGLLVSTPAEAALFLDRLLTGDLLPAALLTAMREPRAVTIVDQGRPWRAPGYGLGLMIDSASPRGLCLGHTGQGQGSSAAAYHFPDLDPPRTAAVFAQVLDPAIIEGAVFALL